MPKGKHKNHRRGSKHPKWNFGSIVSTEGYRKVRVGAGHRLADPNGYAYEHLLVWVGAGNSLPSKDEIIHHINHDKLDNRIENLWCVTRAEHNQHHNEEKGRDSLGRFKKLDGRTWDKMPGGVA